MRSLKNKVLLGLMVLPLFILPSCVDEPDCSLNNEKLVDVKLTITLPEPISKSVTTKAPRTDYNTVNDLNVLVFNTTGTLLLDSYYFDASYTGSSPFPTVTPSLPLNSSPTDNTSATIHICDVEPTSKFYLVANYGSLISVANVTALKNLTQTATNGIPTSCMMYAEATNNGGTQYILEKKAELVRTLSMITVKIDGTNLSVGTGKEIRIIPKTIKLRNVPTSCVLGSDIDNVGTNATNILAGDEAIVTSWGTLTSATGTKIAGGHEETAVPLFQFENKQGEKDLNPDQTAKKVGDKPNSSYIEIEASYQYYENSAINMSGTIIYRFSLGSNITTNFDVVRNTQYAVTLDLSGWGGALEDGHINGSGVLVVDGDAAGVSWRVDLTLRDWGFLQDEFNFDAHANMASVFIRKTGGMSINFISGDPWLKFYAQGGHWKVPANNASGDITNNLLTIYTLPWIMPSGSDYPTPYREFKIEVTHGSSDPPQYVTFRQWAPIKLEDGLYMERFEEDGNNLVWGYNNIPLPNTQSGYTYTFDGAEANGWNNTLYLYNKNSSPMSPAAQLCMKKAGYDLIGIPGDAPLDLLEKAAYYMPSKEELGKVIGYVGDPTDPYQYHDPIKTTSDYWSSSAPSDNSKKYTYYWDHVATPQVSPVTTIYATTNTRNTPRNVRCVYRPSMNPAAGALSPFIR